MTETVDFERLSGELLRRLRGRRSQRSFSRALGFDSNVSYAWESGRRSPETSLFLRAAERPHPQLSSQLQQLLQSSVTGRLGSPRTVQSLVTHLVGRGNKAELSERIGVDRTTLSRWLKGKTEPRLPEFLRLVDATTQRLLSFVALFVDPSRLESTRAATEDLMVQRKLAYELPWSHAILRALELDGYLALPAHRPGVLASSIGISREEEARYLEELENAGQIRWDGQRYTVARVLAVDTREDAKKNLELKRHWASVGSQRLGQPDTSSDGLFSFNLFAINEEGFRRIRELHLDYYDRVRAIIDESPSAARVVLMNLQLIPLERAREAEEC